MFKKILLASDGSAHALRAAESAKEIASLSGESKVTVVYVVDGATSKTDVLSEGSKQAIMEKRKKRLQATEDLLSVNNVKFEVEVLRGEPGPAIVKYTNIYNYDLVVIGSRGLNTLQEMVLGSVSHKVAKRVDCPVMIVK